MNERILWDAIEVYLAVYFLIIAKPIVKPKVVPIRTKDEYARQNRYTRHRVNSWDHGEGDYGND